MQFALNAGALCGPTFCPLPGPHWKLSIAKAFKSRDAVALATLRGWVRMDSVFFPFVLQANLCSWAGVAQKTEQDSLVWAGGLFKAEWNHLVLRVCSQCQAPESHPPEPHKSCHFRQLKWFYNALHMPHKPWRPCRELGESFGCLCYLMLMFLLSSSELKRIRGIWCRTSVPCQHEATSDMRWNKPSRHLPSLVVVASCNDTIFPLLMHFGTLKQKGGLNSNGSSNIGVDQT